MMTAFTHAKLLAPLMLAAALSSPARAADIVAWNEAGLLFAGLGCPPGTVAATAPAANLAVSFDALHTPPNKGCQVRVPAEVRRGHYIARLKVSVRCDMFNSTAGNARVMLYDMRFGSQVIPPKTWLAGPATSGCGTFVSATFPVNATCASGAGIPTAFDFKASVSALAANFAAIKRVDAVLEPVSVVSLCP